MNPVTLEAIKLFLEMQKTANKETKAMLEKMVEKMLFICETDIEQAFTKYSKILN